MPPFGHPFQSQSRSKKRSKFDLQKRSTQRAPRGSQEAPRGSQEVPRRSQEAPKRPSGGARRCPRGPQEAPKRIQEAPRGAKRRPRGWKRMPRGSKRVQGATRGHQEGARGQRREDEQRSCTCHTCFQGQENDRHQTESQKALSPLSVHSQNRLSIDSQEIRSNRTDRPSDRLAILTWSPSRDPTRS